MKPASAPGYDRFKTIVTVILAVILILMLLRGCATNSVAQASSENLPAAGATDVPPTPALLPRLRSSAVRPASRSALTPISGGRSASRMAQKDGQQNRRLTRQAISWNPFHN